jgi:hypothetical protein
MSINTLLQSLIPNRTPPGGVVRSVGAMPSVAPAGVLSSAPAPAAPQLSPTAKYIQDMQALMSGGIGPLSTAQKIAAAGQVLQAAGSRGASDPAAVLQNVRKQQMDKLNAQYQIAQLQQSQQQAARQSAFVKQYASALPEDKRGVLENADPAEAFKIVQEEAFRQKQVFNRDRDPVTGNVRLTFGDGSFTVTDQKMPAKTREIDAGDAVEIYDEDTNQLVMSVPKRMNAYQSASLGIQRARLANDIRTGGSSGGGGTSFQFRTTADGTIKAFDPKNPTRVIDTGQKGAKSSGVTIEGSAADELARRLKLLR